MNIEELKTKLATSLEQLAHKGGSFGDGYIEHLPFHWEAFRSAFGTRAVRMQVWVYSVEMELLFAGTCIVD